MTKLSITDSAQKIGKKVSRLRKKSWIQKLRCLTSKVNALFLLKSRFIGDYLGVNKKLPTKNDEESFLVDKRFEISNLDLIRDMANIMNIEKVLPENRKDNIWS